MAENAERDARRTATIPYDANLSKSGCYTVRHCIISDTKIVQPNLADYLNSDNERYLRPYEGTDMGRFLAWLLYISDKDGSDEQWIKEASHLLSGLEWDKKGEFGYPVRGDIPNEIKGTSGWNPKYIDDDNSPARHFFGFLALGYEKYITAGIALRRNEAPGRAGNSRQDLRSGEAAISLGRYLHLGGTRQNVIKGIVSIVGQPSYPGGRPEPEHTNWLDFISGF